MLNAILEYLKGFDIYFLKKINQDWTFSAATQYFTYITDLHKKPEFLYVIAPLLVALIIYKYKKKALKLLVLIGICLACTDLFTYRVAKQYFQRQRPENAGVHVILRDGHHGGPSFPSNHASNIFALAFLLSQIWPLGRPFYYFFAVSIAYSRPYVGVHYPSDVIAGAILGTALAYLVWMLLGKWVKSA